MQVMHYQYVQVIITNMFRHYQYVQVEYYIEVQSIAFGVSSNLNLQSQSPWL